MDVYLYDEEFEVRNHGVPGVHIGNGSVTYYDATNYSVFDLRMIAKVHGANIGGFQMLYSVRIFSSPLEMKNFFKGDKSFLEEEGVLDPSDFNPMNLRQ